jgi:transposase
MRLSYDSATRYYLQGRSAEGKIKTEAIRCLKRYVARELYAYLPQQTLLDGT